jgi:hypothetical protein
MHRHFNDIPVRDLGSLDDSIGYFIGLPQSEPDMTGPVTHHDYSAEAEPPATFDNLGASTDIHHYLFEFGLPTLLFLET